MSTIVKSVGRGAINHEADVKIIQRLLNLAVEAINLNEDGKIGPATISAIDYFQYHYVGVKPDGRIDPNGASLILLNKKAENPQCASDRVDLPSLGNASKLQDNDFTQASTKLGCEVAAIRAVTEIESKGDGFLVSKRPKILFEAHIFSRLTYHCFDKSYPDISSKAWNKKLYKGNEDEYPRLIKAMAIDRNAALQSASWGMFQIMGFNYRASGYSAVERFVEDMFKSESEHLSAFVEYIKTNKLTSTLKDKNWAAFAAAFNGPDYAQNAYDTKMAAVYKKFAGLK
ncbi:N-acetylmuramidase family protein [Methylomonas montana]|uniref:N-acetylmuramidase family protein n=1 Tax=Methylomonas montana TaxID=3058963 RepID=UPI002659C425|nr:N-acetylmuramidase family protein [Methylomonas montana]WKJ90882.1 N-acetylmuramidase family protein [Methylomonas montana]